MNYNLLSKKELIDMVREFEVSSDRKTVSSPADITNALSKYRTKKVEYFLCVHLDSAHKITRIEEVTKGLINRSLAHPREVFRKAIISNSQSVVVAHNHPSGSLEPSEEDKGITQRLVAAGELLGVPVLDHLIISKEGYFSFKENGLLK